MSAADKARREREEANFAAVMREKAKYGYVPKWIYDEQEDEMGRGTDYWARVQSSNTVDLKFPYQGTQRATLTLQSNAKKGHYVYLSVEGANSLRALTDLNEMSRLDSMMASYRSSARPVPALEIQT